MGGRDNFQVRESMKKVTIYRCLSVIPSPATRVSAS